MIVEQRFKYLKFKLVKRQVLKDKHEVAFYTSFAILCCILLFTNFLPPCGDLFIICSAILQDYPHIRPFWFSFSQLLILVTSSECLISNSLSIVLVYPLAVLLLPAVVCLPSKCACICERQTDRQTFICLVDYSKWWLYKQPHIHTPLNCHSNCIHCVCDFKWEKDSWRKWVMFWFYDGGEDCLSGSDGASVPHHPTLI